MRLAVFVGIVIGAVAAWPAGAHAVTFNRPPTEPLIPPFNVSHGIQSLVAGDFNGDSDPDLAVAHQDGDKISVVLGSTGGTFTAPTHFTLFTHANPLAVAVGDFNGDSDPDLAIASEGDQSGTPPQGSLSVLLGSTGSSFTGPANYPATHRPQGVSVGEFNGDGDPDVVVSNDDGNISVFLGSTGGTFNPATNYLSSNRARGAGIGDFDGDSDQDLAIVNKDTDNVSVFPGGSGGNFGPPTTYSSSLTPHAIAAGRFDSGSDPDLVVVNETLNSVSVLLGGAGASFGAPVTFAVGSLPDAVVVGELNGDGDSDLVVANQTSDTVSMLVGSTGGSFTPATHFAAGDGPTAVVIEDFNGDTFPDIAVTNEISNSVSILLAAPPETTITSGPSGLTNDSTPTFSFLSNDPASTFQCRIDSTNESDFQNCSSPRTVSLGDGQHTFEVRAIDDAARKDPSPATLSFTIDTNPPSVPTVMATNPASPANENSPKLRGSAAPNSIVRIYATAGCSGGPIATGPAATFASPGLVVSVADNTTTTFRATATDEAGNSSACSTTSVTYEEVSPPPPPDPGPPPPPAGGGPPSGPSGPSGPVIGGSIGRDTAGPAMAITGKVLKLERSGAVRVALTCPASEPGGCKGTLSLDALVPARPSGGSGKRKLKLGKGSFTLAGGGKAKVQVRLSAKSKRLVKKLKKIRVLAVVDARDGAGNASSRSITLTLKAAPVKRR